MPAVGDHVQVTIDALGTQGDGVARLGAERVFVPFTLPGDRLAIRLSGRRGDGLTGEIVARLHEEPRAMPACRHFGSCGGCRLQHLPAAAYAAFKRAQVVEALARRGLGEVPVEPAWLGPPTSRRRARFAFRREAKRVELGFRGPAARHPVDLAECPVLLPAIVQAVPALRQGLGRLTMAAEGELQVSATMHGLDALLITSRAPALADREALAALAEAADLARLCWAPAAGAEAEPVAWRRPVEVTIGGIPVAPPPRAFLQASAPAEAAIRAAVVEALGEAPRVADLFAGCGTFALPLAAAGRRVRAVEVDPAMAGALGEAARRAGLDGRLEVTVRDLERAPLAATELAGLDAIVLDPPRAGARGQSEALAGSAIARVAMVSCQPATFARDARQLVDGGFQLLWVRPIDAFLWSSRIELVGAFARPGRRAAA